VSLLNEWIAKAEADDKSALALQRRRKEPLPDIVCYHCQQCVEKYLKAYLSSGQIAYLRGQLSGYGWRR
jgi:HEPN domain-containing protein